MRGAALLASAVLLAGCASTVGGHSRFVGGGSPVGDYTLPVRSVVDQKFADVVRQQYDFSCGSAALATLLRYHYDLAVDEDDAFRGMWSKGDRSQIRKVGFSLLDMKRWLASHRLTADGYRVPLDRVASTGVPGIALIAIKNYRHFVVVKGVRDQEVLLGDPSSGLTVMARADFEKAWNGIYFVLSEDQKRGKARFNRPSQWAAYPGAPIGGRFADPVSQQALSLTAPQQGEF